MITTYFSPFQINEGIKQIISKINKDCGELSWTELSYYKMRIMGEVERLNRAVYMVPERVQDDIADVHLPMLSSAIEQINTRLADMSRDENMVEGKQKPTIDELTARLRAICN